MKEKYENCSREILEAEIDRWVICMRNAERNRAILKRALIDGVPYERIAEEHDLSVSQVKNIIYKSESKLFAHWNP